ncbi:MAG: hypothetical protein JWQ49_4502 [Edaphobacter sp.]|nr:hypothetical protein [Edaphobacter sp.]
MKKIIFCADGTWSHPKSTTTVSDTDTNVYKLYKSLPTTATQCPRYDDGIGADGILINRLLGGAFGTGLFNKVKEGYTKIAHDYLDGDEIFLFGFSRGAYTARSIGGMLACCGLPANLTQQAIEDGFSAYRMTPQSAGRAAALADLKTKYGNRPVTITMIGVWDTVGSLGIPSIIGAVDPIRYGFLDTKLSGSVKAAYQALAIDERRRSFPPTLWVADNVPGQILEQVWFTGCHSSVGGGCPDAGLSNLTLKWMLQKGQQHGLEIDPAVLKIYMAIDAAAHGLDQIKESWSILWGIPAVRSVSDDSTLASTVPSRLTHLADYKPCNLKLTAARAVAPSYTIMTV